MNTRSDSFYLTVTGMSTTFPQCIFSLEIPEILSQNLHAIID